MTAVISSTGTVLQRQVYSAYGTVTFLTAGWLSTSDGYSLVHLWQGGKLDATTGMYLFEARWYSVTEQRWMSADPIGYGDGMNDYLGLRANPETGCDPSGTQEDAADGANDGGPLPMTNVVDQPSPYPAPAGYFWHWQQYVALARWPDHLRVPSTLAGIIWLKQWWPGRRRQWWPGRRRRIGGSVAGPAGGEGRGAAGTGGGGGVGGPGSHDIEPPYNSKAGNGLNQQTTVIGHNPDYVDLAKIINGNVFNIPSGIWNQMTAAEQWEANQRFLDQAIARGDIIILATPVNQARPDSTYAKELQYLMKKGYTVSSDGNRFCRHREVPNEP